MTIQKLPTSLSIITLACFVFSVAPMLYAEPANHDATDLSKQEALKTPKKFLDLSDKKRKAIPAREALKLLSQEQLAEISERSGDSPEELRAMINREPHLEMDEFGNLIFGDPAPQDLTK